MPVNTIKRPWTVILFVVTALVATAAWPGNAQFTELIGSLVITLSCFSILYVYLLNNFPGVLKDTMKSLFILSLIISFFILMRLLERGNESSLQLLVPFALVPVVIKAFYDGRLALFVLFITVFLSSFLAPVPFDFAFMNVITGSTAVLALNNMHGRWRFLVTAVIVGLSYSAVYTALAMLAAEPAADRVLRDLPLLWGNALLVLLCYPLIFIFEKRFKFLSDTTLLELCDTNHPLLRKLAEEAPGSYQHSLQVANLAEEAARVTGANPLLARAGALYHDIGKIAGPVFYGENQKSEVNPHDEMDPRASAKAIISHVNSGAVLAGNFRLPPQIIDFIHTHHGTSIAYYFYKKHKDANPSDDDGTSNFAYPGPKPFSKETAIVMMADSVEAASRSLGKQTDENISELVERIILLQEQDGQYSEVPFTYKDISDIKEAFKKMLVTIYHGRVSYPERSAE